METIYTLTISNIEEEEAFDMYFTEKEKATIFINTNFNYDNPKKITIDHFEGDKNGYFINEHSVNQIKL